MSVTIGARLTISFAIPIAVFGLSVASTIYEQDAQRESHSWVTHTYRVLHQIERVEGELLDAETGQRGFLLTGKEAYLEPFLRGRQAVHRALDSLRVLTADNPVQQHRLRAAASLVAVKLAELEETVRLRRDEGLDSALVVVLSDRGARAMEEFRTLLASVRGEEEALLASRQASLEAEEAALAGVLLGGSVLSVLALIGAGLWLRKTLVTPIVSLTAAAKGVADGQLETDRLTPRADEIGVLQGAFQSMIAALRALDEDAQLLSRAAVAGQLATRADGTRHKGAFRAIIDGFNATLDAVTIPLNVTAEVIRRVANDEIPGPITAGFQGEFERLRSHVNTMVHNLRKINGELRHGFDVLATSSAEILSTIAQVSTGATETASAVSETSATTEEVKQTARLSHQKARVVEQSAKRTLDVTEAGRKAVADTVGGMVGIREQMDQIGRSVMRLSDQGQAIGEIIATVNDLAEQSNLLAVNAAIEATRAGEFGKSFAVVAREVKSLAQQSREATTQVRRILMEVQKATSAAVTATEQGARTVDVGVEQARGAGEAIDALAKSVDESARTAVQIAASSQQQLVGMDQIAAAIKNIREATSQNVHGSRQLQEAVEKLTRLGTRLKETVERQRLVD